MKFKVGDKVKTINSSYPDTYEIERIADDGRMFLVNVRGYWTKEWLVYVAGKQTVGFLIED